MPVLARAGEALSLAQRKCPKNTCPTRACFLIFSQRIEHPCDTLSLLDRAKIGVLADFDADVALKFGAR
jgi:hypothetical protein